MSDEARRLLIAARRLLRALDQASVSDTEVVNAEIAMREVIAWMNGFDEELES